MSNIQLFLCLFLAVTGSCVAGPETVYGKKGSSVVFICPLKNTSTNSVLWTFVNSSIVLPISDGTYKLESCPLYSRVSIVGNHAAGEYNLQLSGLQESDEEVYRCAVGQNLRDYKLILLAAPSSLTLQDVTTDNKILGSEGQSLTLRCNAEGGKPPPLVTITVGNDVLISGEQTVTYTLPTLQRGYDKQMIRCDANSSALTSPLVATATLYLYLKPLQPIFSLGPISIDDTKLLEVSCTSTGSRPAATFQWTLGLSTVTSYSTTQATNTGDGIYTVTSTLKFNMDRTFNGQKLTCVAYNSVLTNGANSSKTLDVRFAPHITVTNVSYIQNTGKITITCTLDGNPTTYTYYRWQHKSIYGALIREFDGGQNLTLPSVTLENSYQDSGVYICTASNGVADRTGQIQQTGSGYVTVNAQPVFTIDNNSTLHGVFGNYVDIHVNVYSVPIYKSFTWSKSSKTITNSDKYILSVSADIVTDAFHNTTVELDGYRFTLTIKNLVESDFNISYGVEVSNGVLQPVVYTIFLVSASGPQTPINFTILRSTESSIVVQWEAGCNGGQEQIFVLQFRRYGSSVWVVIKIPDTKQAGIQTFTVSDLQDGILFELTMYAENMFKKSLPTETKTVATIKDSRLSSSEDEKKVIAGCLSAVIFIMFTIIIALFVLWKAGTNRKKSKAQYSRWKEETAYSIPMDCKETDKKADSVDKRGQNQSEKSSQEYETLGMADKPKTYSELYSQQGQPADTATNYYESLGDQDKPRIGQNTNNLKGQPNSEYTNIMI